MHILVGFKVSLMEGGIDVCYIGLGCHVWNILVLSNAIVNDQNNLLLFWQGEVKSK